MEEIRFVDHKKYFLKTHIFDRTQKIRNKAEKK